MRAFSTTVAVLLFLLSLELRSAQCTDENLVYALDFQWKQILEAAPPLDRDVRGEKLLKLIEGRLDVKVPCWWQPLVKNIGVGPRSAHMIEDDEAVKQLAKRWTRSENAPFTGFDTMTGSVNEKNLRLSDGQKTLFLTHQIDWRDTEDEIENGSNGLSGRIEGENCFLVPECPATGAGGPSALYCFDIREGKLKWRADLLRGERGAYNHLEFGSFTEVMVHEGRVIVWTGSEIAAIVQAFNVNDGEPLLRFSTNGHRL